MKRQLSSLLLTIFIGIGVHAQTGNLPQVDKSPLDMSYFPAGYPILKIQDKATEPLVARVLYSRPQKNGRTVFGELVEYGKVWRLGANEATEIEFYRDVKFGSTRVKKGRYTLYAIPTAEQWIVILNKDSDTWGAFKYDQKKDVARLTVFGELVEYGKVWRLGANEATEIEFYRDVKFGSTRVKKGRYTLYAIPTAEQWIVILNKDSDTWGAFKYDQKKDVARLTVKPEKSADTVEFFTLYFEKAPAGFQLVAHWDNLRCAIPFTY